MTPKSERLRLGVLAYVPPSKISYSDAFDENLRKYKLRNSLVVFRDAGLGQHKPGDIAIPPLDGAIRFGARKRPWSINNLAFLQALQIADKLQFDWFIYLEADCRMKGECWDERIYDEFFGPDFNNPVFGGSPVCWNPADSGADCLARVTRFAYQHLERTGIPMPIYAGMYGDRKQLCFYPNGAGGVYNVQLTKACFGGLTRRLDQLATDITAWDMVVGFEMFKLVGNSIFDKFASLRCAYSGYGETMMSLQERKHLLESGQKVLVHQVKDPHYIP